MRDKERATIKDITNVIRQLDTDQRNKLLWISEGMALATKGANDERGANVTNVS